MRIFGHGTLAPDNLINSAASFPIARASGADGVELDVRLSSDGSAVVIHDAHYIDGRPVNATPAADRPPEVLLLDEALDLCSGLTVNIEVKNYPQDEFFDPDERLADAVVELVGRRSGADEVLVSCFGPAALDRVRSLAGLSTAFLLLSRKPAAEVIERCIEVGHPVVHPYVEMVDDRFMHLAYEHGLTVNVWTGFEETDEMIQRLLDVGVDGLITGNPERAVRLRG